MYAARHRKSSRVAAHAAHAGRVLVGPFLIDRFVYCSYVIVFFISQLIVSSVHAFKEKQASYFYIWFVGLSDSVSTLEQQVYNNIIHPSNAYWIFFIA